MIDIIKLNKTYTLGTQKINVLSDVSLKINSGDFVGIIGDSGSGKSTLANIIAGLERPTSGEVFVDSHPLSKMKDSAISKFRNKVLGFVFQSFHLLPDMTALDNVMLPLSFSKVPKKQRIPMALEALERVGLSNRAEHKPPELSGGQKQRVSIARALINHPKIIIADEPTGNLDSRSANMVLDILKNVNRQGITILMVTHNPAHISMFSQIISIKDGLSYQDTCQ